ncbi:MAG: hypothetical protein ACUVQY_03915 [Thermoproteota archaeon]
MKGKGIVMMLTVWLFLLLILAWAPWIDDQAVHDRVLFEKGWKDGTIQPLENVITSEEVLQYLIGESRKKGVYDGILIYDYNFKWVPFGRWVASCEGGYFVTFWGEALP